MAYLIHYGRASGRLTAAMCSGSARETVELVRFLAACGFTVSTIWCTSGAGRSMTVEELAARARPRQRPALAILPTPCVRPEDQPASIEQLEVRAWPERPPMAGEPLEANQQPERSPSAASATIMALIKRHSIAASIL